MEAFLQELLENFQGSRGRLSGSSVENSRGITEAIHERFLDEISKGIRERNFWTIFSRNQKEEDLKNTQRRSKEIIIEFLEFFFIF